MVAPALKSTVMATVRKEVTQVERREQILIHSDLMA
jgi:hypothetical protein